MSEADLVIQACAGDGRATDLLMRRHMKRLQAVTRRLRNTPADRDDLLQDALLAAFTSLGRIEQPRAFARWIRAVLQNKAWETWRSARIEARILDKSENADVSDMEAARTSCPERAVETREALALLGSLPPKLATAVYLRHIEDRRLDEIAQTMGASLASVKRWLKQAELFMRAQLGEDRPLRHVGEDGAAEDDEPPAQAVA